MDLSDSQVDALNQDTDVAAARRAFLSKLAEGFKTKNDELVKEAREVHLVHYIGVFKERLTQVIENPPVPKEKRVQKFNGFGTRA